MLNVATEKIKKMFHLDEDVISMLKDDHRKVEELFETFAKCRTSRRRAKVIAEIVEELTVHSEAEQKVVYSVLRKLAPDENKEAVEEHHVIKLLVMELSQCTGAEDNIKAKVEVLREIVDHHVREEEHELLPKLKKTDEDLQAMGEAFQKEKQKLLKRQPRGRMLKNRSAKPKRHRAA